MASAFFGLTVPGNIGEMDRLEPYPKLALATTTILNRHGFNAGFKWEECDKAPERHSLNGSYIYRIAPSQYTASSRSALYWTLESLNEFNDESEARFDIATGILTKRSIGRAKSVLESR